jgi:hypothetical protein
MCVSKFVCTFVFSVKLPTKLDLICIYFEDFYGFSNLCVNVPLKNIKKTSTIIY